MFNLSPAQLLLKSEATWGQVSRFLTVPGWFVNLARGGPVLLLSFSLGCCLLLWPGLVQAATWHPVMEETQGQQQFIDIDSIQPLGPGQVRVASYYIDRRSGDVQRTTYITDYDCQRRLFRDVQFDGPVGSASWQPVDPDPLNAAAMEYTCARIQTTGPGLPSR